jgi:hypothetical protein
VTGERAGDGAGDEERAVLLDGRGVTGNIGLQCCEAPDWLKLKIEI